MCAGDGFLPVQFMPSADSFCSFGMDGLSLPKVVMVLVKRIVINICLMVTGSILVIYIHTHE